MGSGAVSIVEMEGMENVAATEDDDVVFVEKGERAADWAG
jgi:hypothetical protein